MIQTVCITTCKQVKLRWSKIDNKNLTLYSLYNYCYTRRKEKRTPKKIHVSFTATTAFVGLQTKLVVRMCSVKITNYIIPLHIQKERFLNLVMFIKLN